MFSWVCPRCGHEVPPSKTECPFCFPPGGEPPAEPISPPLRLEPQVQPAPQVQPVPPVPQPPPVAPLSNPNPVTQAVEPPGPLRAWQPSEAPPPQQPLAQAPPPPVAPAVYPYQPPPAPSPHPAAPPHYAAPPTVHYVPPAWQPEEESRKPAWVMAMLAFGGVLALFAAAYYVMGMHNSSSAPPVKETTAKTETTNPLQKYIEVVGVRLMSAKGGQTVRFLVVNHAAAELTDLSANVTLYANTQRSEEDPVGTFTFHLASIGASESKEMTAPLKTDKAAYDMPEDWRNISADVQVQGPQ